MTLDEAIERYVQMGERDPLSVARKIEAENDRDWLASELFGLAGEIISERARQRIGALRRSAEVAVQPGDVQAAGELKLRQLWVPERGWIRWAEASADDLDARAGWQERFANGILLRASWYRQVAGLMRAEGAEKFGALKAEVPPVPLAELEAA